MSVPDGDSSQTTGHRRGVPGHVSTGIAAALIPPASNDNLVAFTTIGASAPAWPVADTQVKDLRSGCAVAICTYKRAASLERFLGSLVLQERRPEELLIIDASPDDATERMIRQFTQVNGVAERVLYCRVSNPLQGLTRQRNVALRWVTLDAAAFFDADVVLLPGCLREMERSLRLPGESIVGVGACIVNERRRPHLRWKLWRLFGLVPNLQAGKCCRCGCVVPWAFLPPTSSFVEGDVLPGGAMMLSTALSRETRVYEGFSGYGSGEDVEFSLRMSSHGRLVMAGAAHVEHVHDPGGRPDPHRLGYMSAAHSYTIHRRCLANRN